MRISFEDRFREYFRLDLPPPIALPSEKPSLFARRHTSEKFWKRKPSFKLVSRGTLRFKPKFFIKNFDDEATTTKEVENDNEQAPAVPTIVVADRVPSPSLSSSVTSLPSLTETTPLNLSPSIEQCLPLSASFSVLTIGNNTQMSRDIFPQFGGDMCTSTFKNKFSRSYPAEELDKLSRSAPPKVFTSSAKSRLSSTLDSPLTNGGFNFYGEDYKAIPRTDFKISSNLRVSAIVAKNSLNNLSKPQGETTKVQNVREPSTNSVLDPPKDSQDPVPKNSDNLALKKQILEQTLRIKAPVSKTPPQRQDIKKPEIKAKPITLRTPKIVKNSSKLVLPETEINNNTINPYSVQYRKRCSSESTLSVNLGNDAQRYSKFSVKDLVAKFDCADCSAQFGVTGNRLVNPKKLLV